MTAPGLSRFAKVELTNLAQIGEGHAARISLHQVEDFLNPRHIGIISILISFVKMDFGRKQCFCRSA